MLIPVIISLAMLNTPFECVQHLDVAITNRPGKSTVRYNSINTALVSLHEAHVQLKCDGNVYVVTLLSEENYELGRTNLYTK